MKSRLVALVLGVLTLSFFIASAPANANGFRRIELGYEVADWFPVDIDGVWELALTLNDQSVSVGVFSPLTATWRDGPHDLPVTRRQWGAGDYDDNGSLEYAYRLADSILIYDPGDGQETLLWRIPSDQNGRAIFWGESAEGDPLVGIISDHDSSITHNYGTVETSEWSVAGVFELLKGTRVRECPAGKSEWHFVYGYDQEGSTRLVLDRQETSQGCGTMISTTRWLYKYSVLNADWTVHQEYHHDYLNEVGCRILVVPRLTSVACAPSSAPEGIRLLTGLSYDPLNSCTFYGHMRDETNPQWVKGVSDHLYAGAAAFDLNANGTVSWILPTADDAGWEIRDLETGTVTDTLEGLPAEDLHTGPLFSAGVPDLFYFAGSGLYIWGLTTDVEDGETSPAPVPRNLTIHAYPNPFNSSVTLSWPSGYSPTALDILNILGQRIRTYELGSDAGFTSVEWDGLDQTSRAMPSGVYFARLITDHQTAITKIVLLK